MSENISPAPAEREEVRPPDPSKAAGAGGSIRPGDVVRHRPTGETWLVLGVDTPGDRICWFGWPAGYATLSDCELLERGKRPPTNDERRYRNLSICGGWDDDREENERMDREWAL